MLPRPLTPFIGRHQEMADLRRLWANPDCRLLTLLGPGGVGKTRLAVEFAQHESSSQPDGVYFVSLQTVKPELLVTAVADTLSIVLSGQTDPVLKDLPKCSHLVLSSCFTESLTRPLHRLHFPPN
jgi:ATP/maltotriose-dependent transcriptional regulator MalT